MLKAAKRVFHSQFPNPERDGCPGSEILKSMALHREHSRDEDVWDHLACCSPCFVEFNTFLQQARVRKRLQTLALCAVLLITLGVVVWFFAKKFAPNGVRPEKEITHKESLPGPFQKVTLDLRNKSVLRSDERGAIPTPSDESLRLPRGRLELSIYLPIGSEEGRYEIQVLKEPKQSLLTVPGTAKIRDFITVLETKIDLSNLSRGTYLLGIREAQWSWAYYPVLIQ